MEKQSESPSFTEESTAKTTRRSGLVYGAVLTLCMSIISLLLLGLAVDKLTHKSPVFVVLGTLLGTVVGFVQFVKIMGRAASDD